MLFIKSLEKRRSGISRTAIEVSRQGGGRTGVRGKDYMAGPYSKKRV
jgi:hypothetical protein